MKVSAPMPLLGTRPEGVASEAEAADYVRRMFGRIVPRYDFLNHLLSLGLDRRWRRGTAQAVKGKLLHGDSRAIDLCCGTGDLALELARVSPGQVIGSDFCQPMLARAQVKACGSRLRVPLVAADTLALPFADASFTVATAAFGFRNLANYKQGLAEIRRILKPGGLIAILEFALPERGVFRHLYGFYFRHVLPWVGNCFSGVEGPYDYLRESVEKFPTCEEFADWMRAAGFVEVRYQRWSEGAVALHLGMNPLT